MSEMDEIASNNAAAPPAAGSRLKAFASPVILIALAGFLLLAAQWYVSQSEISSLQQELTRRIAESDAYNKESRQIAHDAQGGIKDVEVKVGLLESRLAESQSQQAALEALYQELSRSRDEWALSEIEQMVTIASQQLQLAGNVPAALTALNAADTRLSRSDRAQFIPLRKLLEKDIERLKSLPLADITGMALKVDNLIAKIDSLPLTFDERRQSAPSAANAAKAQPRPEAPAENFWSRASAEIWSELKQLISVTRIDQPDAVLLSPGQSFFLRENLKLRLLNARFGLLARDEANFREDLALAHTWVGRYFDTRAKPVQDFQATLDSLSKSSLNIELPNLSASLTAVRNYKVAHDARNPGAAR
jgi:uroporphyrin-III C-methyltransferase